MKKKKLEKLVKYSVKKYRKAYEMLAKDHECKEECATCLTNDRGDDSALGEIDKNYE